MVTISSESCMIAVVLMLLNTPIVADRLNIPDDTTTPVISPYLEFHRDDLVHWHPWSKATLELARNSNKLILLSSGYYACHYCHVMKRESFENPKVADFINQHFIPVLIDRELHPVLDSQLLRFMEVIGAPQGWPLNVILTPDAHPLVGTVYQPANNFLNVLQQIQMKWETDHAHWERIASAATEQIITESTVPAFVIESSQQRQRILDAFVRQARLVADKKFGGFGNGAKYPMSPQLSSLLNYQMKNPTAWLETHLRTTLHSMASGGLHDHLNGGFFRYTTDRQWQKPHYEKMLYDNAQLVMIYLDAARIFDEAVFQLVAEKTLDFMLQSMSDDKNGFIASLAAADESGRDGGYYLWSEDELRLILQPVEYKLAFHLWQTIEQRDVQDRQYYLPRAYPSGKTDIAMLAKKLGLSSLQVRSSIRSLHLKMLSASTKQQLLRDEKNLAGWNGLALRSFSRAAHQTGIKRFHKTADNLYRFILQNFWNGKLLQRTPEGGNAELSDYAYLVAGLVEYARLTNESGHYQSAAILANTAWQKFYLDGFWRRGADLELLLPYTIYPVSLPDHALPSPSATLIEATLQLDDLMESRYTNYAHLAQRTADSDLLESPFFYGTQIMSW